MTEVFKVAYLAELGKPLEITEVYFPSLRAGQILVSVEATGICGSQLSEIEGRKGNEAYLPHLMGHEGVGLVREVHPTVSKVAVGDRVVIHWKKGGGLDGGIVTYKSLSGLSISGGPATTFSEYSVVSENRVSLIPNDLATGLAVLLGCALSTALGAVDKEAVIRFGSRVLVVGLGGVGTAVAAASVLRGAHPVVGFDSNPSKRSLAEEVGVSHFFSDMTQLESNVTELENRFDFIFEVSGDTEIRKKCASFLKPGGQVIFLGQRAPSVEVSIGNEAFAFGSEGHSFKFSQGGGFDPDHDIMRWGRFLQSKTSQLSFLFETHLGGLEQLNSLLNDLRAGKNRARQVLHLNASKE